MKLEFVRYYCGTKIGYTFLGDDNFNLKLEHTTVVPLTANQRSKLSGIEANSYRNKQQAIVNKYTTPQINFHITYKLRGGYSIYKYFINDTYKDITWDSDKGLQIKAAKQAIKTMVELMGAFESLHNDTKYTESRIRDIIRRCLINNSINVEKVDPIFQLIFKHIKKKAKGLPEITKFTLLKAVNDIIKDKKESSFQVERPVIVITGETLYVTPKTVSTKVRTLINELFSNI
jgi:hypothetical protein